MSHPTQMTLDLLKSELLDRARLLGDQAKQVAALPCSDNAELTIHLIAFSEIAGGFKEIVNALNILMAIAEPNDDEERGMI